MKAKEELHARVELRQNKYLNNLAQDHRFSQTTKSARHGVSLFNKSDGRSIRERLWTCARIGRCGVDKGDVLVSTEYARSVFLVAA